MKKLTVTVVLMLALTSGMAAAVAETPTPLSAAYMKEIPRLRGGNDGIALFAKNDATALNQVMTSNPLYALLSMLKADGALSDLVQTGEYVLLMNALTEINHRLDALLSETAAGNKRLLALVERLAANP